MASENWWECRDETGECDDDDDPRISLSQGLFMSVDFCADSAQHAAEVGGSSYSSSEFEFLTPSLCTAAAATPHLQRSPSCSMSAADQLFCNGRILPLPLPLHQTHASHITIADHVRSERRPANELAAAANISRRLKDMLKLENPKQKKIQSTNCSRDKHPPAAARSLWFLRRCRSTNDKEDDPDCCLRSVDPWLGRSASDSRMNPFGGGGASRQASAKPQTKSFGKSDSFRSYTHVLSRNSSPRRKLSAAIGSQRRSIDAVETRADLKNAMKDNRPHHTSRASKSQLSLDQGLNVPQKRTEFSRSRSQKCVEHCRSSGRQVAPVVNMQICMAQSFLTPNARLADLCNLSFLKKHRAQKQHDVGASATGLSHEPQISSY